MARTDFHEFSVLLPHTSAAEARLVAELVREAVRETSFVVGGETFIQP